eukprot:6701910-Pyramimonas_sp.AAC.1
MSSSMATMWSPTKSPTSCSRLWENAESEEVWSPLAPRISSHWWAACQAADKGGRAFAQIRLM